VSVAEIWTLVAVAILVLISGVLAACETSVSRVNRVHAISLEEEKRRGARFLVRIAADPARYLNPVLLAVLLCHVLGTTLATTVAVRLFPSAGEWIATAVLTTVIFVFAESTPKTFAILHTDRVALALAPLIYVLGRALYPLARVLVTVSNVILPGKGLPKGPFMTEDEIRQIVTVAEEEEVIEEQEREMIHSIFEFGDTTVREVMTPRPDMKVVEASTSVQDAMDMAIKDGFSRIPVHEDDDPDNILGVVYVKDLFRALRENGDAARKVKEFTREAFFVPEMMKVSDLLRQMQKRRVHMAIVADEYGDVAGLVTLEDLLEEIVGEITDEYDVEEAQVVPMGENGWLVRAKLPIWEFNEFVKAELPVDEEWKTVGGLVASVLGEIPEPGAQVTYEGFSFRVERMQRRRIDTVLVRRLPAADGTA
jgi:CBS domain containing-hemolysin-like protein